ncbi:MAG: ABC transporter ATP-binding protein [Thiotrichales bacterium]|jgi:ABC-2 type transport system ATP-binding protein|nr:ABC transporter ATP-binding protein [Thiotrichales bacterium]MBT3613113.1 ABC transporter ATP-binding protein [Thiotrichales bacterium]MBT3752156.1 ABC transporter ATP-binding protein [Thiotrichales bacterium]MBT3838267.1 ABC transporter ATP-binding protein [Thiotrichales bacterium]MBT4152209.1 ABC transporter ATP-binding protein [Thiotrichales bacterium]
MTTSAIELLDVKKRYKNTEALQGVSFSVEQGEFFGLLGPNGAGKSTLINIMGGLVNATSGVVKVMGHDVVRDYRMSRSKIGVVPQELVYDPFFSVWEMLVIQSGYFGLGRENHGWINELLETLKLSDKRDENLHNLSGGMKRRVLIAQALVHRPSVVVLDEPTAGVDVELRRALWEFANRLHSEGHTILLTTHYLEEAESMCDRIAILNKGSCIALDGKDRLIEKSSWRVAVVTDKLAGSEDLFSAALSSAVVSRSRNSTQLRISRDEAAAKNMLQKLSSLGVSDDKIQLREPTLEEIFLTMTADKVIV